MAITSKRVASLASKSLRKDLPRKQEKSVAASALRQVDRRTSKRR